MGNPNCCFMIIAVAFFSPANRRGELYIEIIYLILIVWHDKFEIRIWQKVYNSQKNRKRLLRNSVHQTLSCLNMHNNLVKIVQLLEIFNFKTCKSMKFYLKTPSFLFTSLENWQIISPNRKKLFCTSLLTKSSKPRLKSKTINIISYYFVAKFCCTVKLNSSIVRYSR